MYTNDVREKAIKEKNDAALKILDDLEKAKALFRKTSSDISRLRKEMFEYGYDLKIGQEFTLDGTRYKVFRLDSSCISTYTLVKKGDRWSKSTTNFWTHGDKYDRIKRLDSKVELENE